MNQNTINVVEATPPIVNALKLLKQRTPTMNENSSTKPFGSNGGIKFSPNTDAESKITGPFDVQLTYLEEDGEQVPYIQILDSSVPNAPYAGYVYYQNTIKSILPTVMAPSAGWLYLEIDLINNTATYNIANAVPTYSLQWKKWAYALAYISVTDNVYAIRRVHLPGNIVMPTFEEGYKGYFQLSARVVPVEGGDPKYYIDCADGYCLVNGVMRLVSSSSFEVSSSNVNRYIVLHYTQQIADNGGVESYTATVEHWNSMTGTSLNANDTDSYCLIGIYKRYGGNIEITQQSHGIPTLFTFTSDC